MLPEVIVILVAWMLPVALLAYGKNRMTLQVDAA
jgi:hypothetical protein